MPDHPTKLSKLAEQLVGDLRRARPEDPTRSIVRPTQALNSVLEQLLTKYQIGRDSVEQRIRDQWSQIVGPANASYSHAVSIERNRLLVLTSHSVVRNELFHHRDEIVARLHQIPGGETIKSLNLRAG